MDSKLANLEEWNALERHVERDLWGSGQGPKLCATCVGHCKSIPLVLAKYLPKKSGLESWCEKIKAYLLIIEIGYNVRKEANYPDLCCMATQNLSPNRKPANGPQERHPNFWDAPRPRFQRHHFQIMASYSYLKVVDHKKKWRKPGFKPKNCRLSWILMKEGSQSTNCHQLSSFWFNVTWLSSLSPNQSPRCQDQGQQRSQQQLSQHRAAGKKLHAIRYGQNLTWWAGDFWERCSGWSDTVDSIDCCSGTSQVVSKRISTIQDDQPATFQMEGKMIEIWNTHPVVKGFQVSQEDLSGSTAAAERVRESKAIKAARL